MGLSSLHPHAEDERLPLLQVSESRMLWSDSNGLSFFFFFLNSYVSGSLTCQPVVLPLASTVWCYLLEIRPDSEISNFCLAVRNRVPAADMNVQVR